jgi:hypothetical protein
MPYFFIIPLFLLYVVAMLVGLVVATVVPSLRKARGAMGGVLLWSSVGFIVANSLYFAFFFVFAAAQDKAPSALGVGLLGSLGMLTGPVLGCFLILGPFVLTAAGLGGGALFALRRRGMMGWLTRAGTR